jgi:LytS/YehU family sensor histidine kinase
LDLFVESLKNAAVVIVMAYPLTKFAPFHRALMMAASDWDRTILTLLLTVLSILSNAIGTEMYNGSILSSRVVAPVVGGIVAGPAVGIVVGVCGGLFRLYQGGFTASADLISSSIAGIIGGMIYETLGARRFRVGAVFFAGIFAEITVQAFILLMSRPTIVANALLGWSGYTSILVNGLAVAVFVSIVRDVHDRQYNIGMRHAVQAFNVAQKTLPIVRDELDEKIADKLVEVIYSESNVDAVAITKDGYTLAFRGMGDQYHQPGSPALSCQADAVRDESGRMIVSSKSFQSAEAGCPLTSLVSVPLCYGDEVAGYLEIYKVNDEILPPDVRLAEAIAGMLRMQFYSMKTHLQEKLLSRVEYEALRAQIHPHFLFNALSVIKMLVREDPTRAQDLIVSLSQFFRRSLEIKSDLIPFAEEIKVIEFYLMIQQARFGAALHVTAEIAEECLSVPFPAFAVQPLVENAMNHGFVHDKSNMWLHLSARIDENHLVVTLRDNGIGIRQEILEAVQANRIIPTMGVGLTNVNRRLKSLYGKNYSFDLRNMAVGSMITLRIPVMPG